MANRLKIDYAKLRQMAKEGKKIKEMAVALGVAHSTVSRSLQKIGVAVAGEIALSKAREIVERDLQVKDGLLEIYRAVFREIDVIQAALKDAEGETRAVLQDRLLKHVGEIRKQLALAAEVSRTLFNIEEVKAFQEIVLEEIGAVDTDVKNRIVKRLVDRRAVISSLEIDPGGFKGGH
jgi:DNA-binding transcriptional regulator GbsR (MarR family)